MMNDLKRAWKLIPFGISKTFILVCMVVFVVLGIGFEVAAALDAISFRKGVGFTSSIDIGAVLLFCTAMFPGQLLSSLDVSLIAQSSSLKKKLQVKLTCLMTLVGNVAVMAVIILIRLAVAARMPENFPEIMAALPSIALMGLLLTVYAGMIYKFFLLSMLLLYAAMMGLGIYTGISLAMSSELPSAEWLQALSVTVTIPLSFVLLAVGTGLQYLITNALYKRPFSKNAFGSAGRKLM